MADETSVIERDMAQTRESLGSKVGALEEKVVDTVKDTTEAVSQTVGSVKEAVQSTAEAVTGAVSDSIQTVKESLDLSAHVRNYPWLMMGGGLALGFVLHCLLNSERKAQTTSRSRAATQPPSQGPSWTDSLGSIWESLGPTASKLQGLALGTTCGVLGELVMQYAPQSLKAGLSDLIDNLTQQVGGTVLRAQQHEQQHQQHQQQPHQSHTA